VSGDESASKTVNSPRPLWSVMQGCKRWYVSRMPSYVGRPPIAGSKSEHSRFSSRCASVCYNRIQKRHACAERVVSPKIFTEKEKSRLCESAGGTRQLNQLR
jgi:hypothetical protein